MMRSGQTRRWKGGCKVELDFSRVQMSSLKGTTGDYEYENHRNGRYVVSKKKEHALSSLRSFGTSRGYPRVKVSNAKPTSRSLISNFNLVRAMRLTLVNSQSRITSKKND